MDYRNRFVLAILLTAFLAASCDKPYSLDLPLAVDSRLVKLTAKTGRTRVVVYSDRDWQCSLFSEDGIWAVLDKEHGHGLGDMIFTYEANPGVTRKLAIALSAGSIKDTVWMQQAGAVTSPRFSPGTRSFNFDSSGGQGTSTLSTNLTSCLGRIVPSYNWTEGDGGWISAAKVDENGISFSVAMNITGAVRKAEILFDIPGMVEPSPFPGAVLTVVQNP